MAKAMHEKPKAPPPQPKRTVPANPKGYETESHAYNWRSRNNLKRGAK